MHEINLLQIIFFGKLIKPKDSLDYKIFFKLTRILQKYSNLKFCANNKRKSNMNSKFNPEQIMVIELQYFLIFCSICVIF